MTDVDAAALASYFAAGLRARAGIAEKARQHGLPWPLTPENRLIWMAELIKVMHPVKRCPVPLVANDMQRDIITSYNGSFIGLKSRRAGMTSIICGDSWLDLLTIPGTRAELFAHDRDTADMVFEDVIKYQYEHLPDWAKPRATTDNVRELKFADLDCSFRVNTAGASEAIATKKGQARTIHILIMTEFAFYAFGESFYEKIVNCVPVEGGKKWIDSTPNGMNSFHDRFKLARDGQSEYQAKFYPWWWDRQNTKPGPKPTPTEAEIENIARWVKEYGNPAPGHKIKGIGLTDGQLRFRRSKIAGLSPRGNLTARDRFIVEYPEDEASCFLHSGRNVFMHNSLVVTVDERPAIEGHHHAIGHDASTGDATGHPAGSTVIDLDTNEQIYAWRGWEPLDSQAERLVRLQERYPGLIICERNYPGDAVLILLKRWAVKGIYKHKDRAMKEHTGVKPWKLKPGFPTSAQTKPRLFTDLEMALSNKELFLCSQKTVGDLKGFQYNDNDEIEFMGSAELRQEMGELSHGELGMAIALAWHGRKVGSVGVG